MDDFGKIADVLIVGAGATGILTAVSLLQSGFSVALVDPIGLGAEQSSHSHGYLHRGHQFQAPSVPVLSEHREGANRWLDLFADAGITPSCESSYVGFENTYTAKRFREGWYAGGLEAEPVEFPEFLIPGSLSTVFATQDVSFDFSPWFEYAKQSLLPGIQYIHGEAMEILLTGQVVTGIRLRHAGQVSVVRANSYLFTAGTANIDLVYSATHFRGHGTNRMLFMLALQGPLPLINLHVFDFESHGLFMVSRPQQDDATTWLASNNHSYAHPIGGTFADELWLRSMIGCLQRMFSVMGDDLQWGYYRAPRWGFSNAYKDSLSDQSIEDFGLENLVACTAPKLTLAPVVAEKLVMRIQRQGEPQVSPLRQIADDIVASGTERWQSCPMQPIDSLTRFLTDPNWKLEDACSDRPS